MTTTMRAKEGRGKWAMIQWTKRLSLNPTLNWVNLYKKKQHHQREWDNYDKMHLWLMAKSRTGAIGIMDVLWSIGACLPNFHEQGWIKEVGKVKKGSMKLKEVDFRENKLSLAFSERKREKAWKGWKHFNRG